MARSEGKPLGWATRDEIAAFFGVAAKSFDAVQRKLLPAKGPHIRRWQNRPIFRVADYFKAQRDSDQERLREQIAPPGSDADVMGGPNSPMLEKVREETFLLKRLQRRQKEGALIDRNLLHRGLAENAAGERKFGEDLQRLFGEEALRLHEDRLAQEKHIWDRLLDEAVAEESPEDDG